MSEIDILSIDSKIQQKFEEDKNNLVEYKEKLKDLNRTLEMNNLKTRVRKTLEKSKSDIEERIERIESNTDLNFYIMESAELLDQYKKILESPMKLNFMGKAVKNDKEKQNVIVEYLKVAEKYIDLDVKLPSKKFRVVCQNCSNKKDFDIIDGNVYVCTECSAEQVVLKNISSYRDIDRINITSKYMYDRRIHFRDCMNQYQGKQNCTIPPKVYSDLEDQFRSHHLLVGDENSPKEVRFSRITKEHVSMFLKELEYTKHYENVNLIHYNLTGVKPDDIGYLEDQLLDDFDLLTELYDKNFKNIDRKNFINTQYVLFQLLNRHKHKCNKEDFSILKTIDRKSFHDDIIRVLFEQMGWNYDPIF